MSDWYLPTYVIHNPKRLERKIHIEHQFADKSEFDVQIIEAVIENNGAVGLWKSICKIIKIAQAAHEDCIVICEDDHTFTSAYNKAFFLAQLIEASRHHVELLIGGIGGFGQAVQLADYRFWIDWFYSTQFLVVFEPLFDKILEADFTATDTADGMLSTLTVEKQVIVPFLSVQTDFGYSDVTQANHVQRKLVEELFTYTEARLSYLKYIRHKYAAID